MGFSEKSADIPGKILISALTGFEMPSGVHAGKLIYPCETNEHHVRMTGVKFVW